MGDSKNLCDIKLDSSRGIYYSGQIVTGTVDLKFYSPVTFTVLQASFLGEATVDWTERESVEYNGVKSYREVEYNGREVYVSLQQILAGNNVVTQLHPGTYKYPFKFQIPPHAPSSFNGYRGSVVYTINIKMINQNSEGLSSTREVEVIAPLDLNCAGDKVKEPIELEFEEVACNCLCSSGSVMVRVRLPVSGYCPGQLIPIGLEIDNSSSVEITKMLFQLVKREKYRTQRPVSEYVTPEEVIATVKRGAILSGVKKNVIVDMQVPDIIAPNMEKCTIIDVNYFLKITIKLSGCNDDMDDEAEIYLGLVPIHGTTGSNYVHPLEQHLPDGPIPPPVQNMVTDNHQQAPVPSQNQTIPMGTIGQYPMGTTNYQKSTFSQTVQGNTYVEVKQELKSSNPSENYQIGFVASYPPGTAPPPMYNPTNIPPAYSPGSFNMQPIPALPTNYLSNTVLPSAPPP